MRGCGGEGWWVAHAQEVVDSEKTVYNAPINVIPHLPPPGRSGGNGGDLTF